MEEPEHGTPADRGEKRPFDVDLVFARLREAVAPLPKAAMFELAEEGYDAPFEQLIACILSIRDGVVHPTINYETPDPECDLDYVPNEKRKVDVRYTMSNSLGFGGHNSAIIIGRI